MPAPSNDNFANRIALGTPSGSVSGTTFDATKEASESTTIGTNVQSVWYTFTPTATGWYKFFANDSEIVYHGIRSFENSTLQIRVFPNGALTDMTLTNCLADGANESTNDRDAGAVAFLTNGVTYVIRLASFLDSSPPGGTNSQTCDFTFRYGPISPPANDDLANVVTLGAVPIAQVDQTTFDAIYETGEVIATTSGGSIGNPTREQSVWYKFTPSATGKYKLGLENVSLRGNNPLAVIAQISTQSTLAGYTPANELGRLLLSTLAGGTNAWGYFDLTSGVDYYIRVSTAYGEKNTINSYNGMSVDFDLTIEAVTPPANDNFANAITLSTTLPGLIDNATVRDSTADAGQPTVNPFSAGDQTIWYKFTPTITGQYKFKVPYSSLVYDGDSANPNNGFIMFNLAAVGAVGDFVSANLVPGGTGFVDFPVPEDVVKLVNLTASTTYYICVWCDGTPFNLDTMTFDMEYSLVLPPTNDDFANATAIGGTSGSEVAVFEGATAEASEPGSMYWDTGGQVAGSIWYDWTCPATGHYVFKVEATDDSTSKVSPTYDISVWQGAALNTLTSIARTTAGSQNTEGRVRAPGAAVGFAATNGQSYKIQLVSEDPVYIAAKISWRTNTAPTGDTTATALSLPNGRIDNYGQGSGELPPNAETILSGHDSWWFTDGQPGRVKWFKTVIGVDQTITISGRQWTGLSQSGSSWPLADMGLIVYKGADYASLTVAKQAGTAIDAAMMLRDSVFTESSNHIGALVGLPISGFSNGRVNMQVDAVVGETVWIAVFGIYDASIAGSVVADAAQFDLDLYAPVLPPVNNSRTGTWVSQFNYPYYLGRSEYGAAWTEAAAGKAVGATAGAAADVGDPTIAGFAPTRNVWYVLDIAEPGTYKVWIESSQDCVLGIYEKPFDNSLGALVADDDDSGPGNQPEITTALVQGDYWVVVDSKTEASFTLRWERQATGTPPANDDFADAVVIGAIPYSANGTTVDATAESDEHHAEELAFGPKDTVWYKYVATSDGHLKVKATCNTDNLDAYVYIDTWRGTTLATLVRDPEPPPSGPGGGIFAGFFSFFDTPYELDRAAVTVDVVNGETYYIRVQTESGGSEDFTIYVDTADVYLKLTPSGLDVGPYADDAEVYLRLTPSAIIESHGVIEDAGTVPLTITPITTYEMLGQETVDSGTVYLDLQVLGGECFSRFHFTGEGEADLRWSVVNDLCRWSPDDQLRWTAVVEAQPGC